ncbi:acyltransferase family protein [Bifidobacterium sp. ESL0763]|uniref:acyltransferase family protein n=1 Tax=Bifidobacterium sp. ESL0763 TaxID=2983227 RepID=UPI0023FA11CE|nr:acyltransferase family protein [Bifidobacterium sp. ESL0763]MDF7664264.1 acyltransferase family protein [Bifidobacterium sp. ESL0763]
MLKSDGQGGVKGSLMAERSSDATADAAETADTAADVPADDEPSSAHSAVPSSSSASGSRQRVAWIDTAKGITMFLVFFGHLNATWFPALAPTIGAIFLFHMPAFFVLSGIFFRPGSSFPHLLRHRAWQLLIPYYAFSALLLGQTLGKSLLPAFYAGRPGREGTLGQDIVAIILNTTDGLWFLWSLFTASLLLWCIVRVCGERFLVPIALVLLVADAAVRHVLTRPLPFTLNQVLSSTAYLALGFACRKALLALTRRRAACLALVCTPVFLCLAWLSARPWIATRWTSAWAVSILASLFGTGMLLGISRLLPTLRAVTFVGRATLIYYSLNDIVLKVVKLAVFKLSPVASAALPAVGQFAEGLVVVLLAMALVGLLVPLLKRYLWWAVGLPGPQRFGRGGRRD